MIGSSGGWVVMLVFGGDGYLVGMVFLNSKNGD